MLTNVGYHMTRKPYVAEPTCTITNAHEIMQHWDLRHLPIESKGKLVGIVSERDLKEALALPQAHLLTLQDVMKTDLYYVSRFTPIQLVVQDMADMKIGSALVINEESKVVGIFTTTDALRLLARTFNESADFLFKDTDNHIGAWATAF